MRWRGNPHLRGAGAVSRRPVREDDGGWSVCDCGSGTGGVTGSGGTAPSGGGTPATGGVDATGGAVPTGGTMPTGGTAPTGGGGSDAIVIEEGYGSDPAHGVQGPWYTYHDPLGTETTPECAEDAGGTCYGDVSGTEICLTGSALMVPCDGSACDYDNYWGGALAFNLNQGPEEGALEQAWDATAYEGVEFVIDNPWGTGLRVLLKVLGNDTLNYCYDVTESGVYTLRWQHFRLDCWTGGTDSIPAADLMNLRAVAWQIVPSTIEDIDFDFCVSELRIF